MFSTSVPAGYVEDCVAAGELIPFRRWAMGWPTPSDPLFLNPFTDSSLEETPIHFEGASRGGHHGSDRRWLLGVTEHGNVDHRCREVEELNQSVRDMKEQNWPAVGGDGRKSIYLLPIVTWAGKQARKGKFASAAGGGITGVPDDPALLDALATFLGPYFGADVRALKPTEIKIGKASAKVCGVNVAVERVGTDSGAAASATTPVLSVLDLLDAIETQLPPDGYCVLGLTSERIYEGEVGTGTEMLGRAFGGSRIAAFSTATMLESGGAKRAKTSFTASFAHLVATVAHETMHCFGLDHCGLYSCCMNSWADTVGEFAPPPHHDHAWDGDAVVGVVHLCPVCVRKLQIPCGFELKDRCAALAKACAAIGLDEQSAWYKEVGARAIAAVDHQEGVAESASSNIDIEVESNGDDKSPDSSPVLPLAARLATRRRPK